MSVEATVNTMGDKVSPLDIKPDRISRGRFVGFCEVASGCNVECGLRETLLGCRRLVVDFLKELTGGGCQGTVQIKEYKEENAPTRPRYFRPRLHDDGNPVCLSL